MTGTERRRSTARTADSGRMTRRRYVGGMVAAVGGGGLLSAWGGVGSGAPAKDSATKAPVTVEYWTFWTQERVDFLLPHLPTFEQRTRYIKANVTGSGDMPAKLRTAVGAGGPPPASSRGILRSTP